MNYNDTMSGSTTIQKGHILIELERLDEIVKLLSAEIDTLMEQLQPIRLLPDTKNAPELGIVEKGERICVLGERIRSNRVTLEFLGKRMQGIRKQIQL